VTTDAARGRFNEMVLPHLDDAYGLVPRRETRDGYSIPEWTERGRLYAAVSDLPPAELDALLH
jgi:hypothetical protein